MIKGNLIALHWHLIFSLPQSTRVALHPYLILKRYFNSVSIKCNTDGAQRPHDSQNKRAFHHPGLANESEGDWGAGAMEGLPLPWKEAIHIQSTPPQPASLPLGWKGRDFKSLFLPHS